MPPPPTHSPKSPPLHQSAPVGKGQDNKHTDLTDIITDSNQLALISCISFIESQVIDCMSAHCCFLRLLYNNYGTEAIIDADNVLHCVRQVIDLMSYDFSTMLPRTRLIACRSIDKSPATLPPHHRSVPFVGELEVT